jgi:hypothetical protein
MKLSEATNFGNICVTVKSRAIAQAVSHSFSLRRPVLAPRSGHVEFVMDRVALGQVCLQVLRYSAPNIIPPVRHIHIGPNERSCSTQTVPPPRNSETRMVAVNPSSAWYSAVSCCDVICFVSTSNSARTTADSRRKYSDFTRSLNCSAGLLSPVNVPVVPTSRHT